MYKTYLKYPTKKSLLWKINNSVTARNLLKLKMSNSSCNHSYFLLLLRHVYVTEVWTFSVSQSKLRSKNIKTQTKSSNFSPSSLWFILKCMLLITYQPLRCISGISCGLVSFITATVKLIWFPISGLWDPFAYQGFECSFRLLLPEMTPCSYNPKNSKQHLESWIMQMKHPSVCWSYDFTYPLKSKANCKCQLYLQLCFLFKSSPNKRQKFLKSCLLQMRPFQGTIGAQTADERTLPLKKYIKLP